MISRTQPLITARAVKGADYTTIVFVMRTALGKVRHTGKALRPTHFVHTMCTACSIGQARILRFFWLQPAGVVLIGGQTARFDASQ
jgi:hypothetical protein